MTFCTYCGMPNPETSDHVPPKAIFTKPYPPNLVTVPCCTKCNNGMSSDDEYFRFMLVSRKDTKENSNVEGLLPKVLRSLERPEHLKFTKSLIQASSIQSIKLQDGSYTETGYHIPDKLRIDKVVARIARGIYRHENNDIFPIEGIITSYSMEDKLIQANNNIRIWIHNLQNSQEKFVGQNTFAYRMSFESENHVGIGLFTFYGKVSFFITFMPHAA